MSRMAEAWQDQPEQENESGIDMHDCYHACHPLEQDTAPRVAVATVCQTDSDLEKPF